MEPAVEPSVNRAMEPAAAETDRNRPETEREPSVEPAVGDPDVVTVKDIVVGSITVPAAACLLDHGEELHPTSRSAPCKVELRLRTRRGESIPAQCPKRLRSKGFGTRASHPVRSVVFMSS